MEYGYTNSDTPLRLTLFDGDLEQFPVAYVADSTGTIIFEKRMTPSLIDGKYVSSFSVSVPGYYDATFKVFTDNTYTEQALIYDIVTDEYLIEERIADQVWNAVPQNSVSGTAGYELYQASSSSGATSLLLDPTFGLQAIMNRMGSIGSGDLVGVIQEEISLVGFIDDGVLLRGFIEEETLE